MKLWLLGIAAAVVLLVGLPALALAFADEPTPAVATNGPGLGPAHDNTGHHYGWSKGQGRSDHESESDDKGHDGPPPWAHGKSKGDSSSHHHGPPPWSHGKHTGTD